MAETTDCVLEKHFLHSCWRSSWHLHVDRQPTNPTTDHWRLLDLLSTGDDTIFGFSFCRELLQSSEVWSCLLISHVRSALLVDVDHPWRMAMSWHAGIFRRISESIDFKNRLLPKLIADYLAGPTREMGTMCSLVE